MEVQILDNEKVIENYELYDEEGKLYNLRLSYDDKMIYFKIFFKNDNLKEKYIINFDIGTLKKSCKTFNLLENCEDSFNFIKDLLKGKKISLKKEKTNLLLIMTVPVLLKEEKIKFILNKQKYNQEEMIEYLLQTVKELKNEIYLNKIEYEKLKNENNDIINRLNILEKWKNEKETQEKKEKEKFNSKIINTNEEILLIKNKFKEKGKIVERINLLFSSSKDGDSNIDVHNKVDGKKDILLIIETNKGRKFGGYTSIGFKENKTDYDSEAFLISFNKLKTYNNIKGSQAIYGNKNGCPSFYSCFGNHNISIPNNFLSKEGYTNKKEDCYYTTEDYELNGGEEKFIVKELEYFQVIFNN